MADADKIKMVVTVKVDKLSVTLAATAADAASGSIWSRTVTPQKSIKLEMNDLSVNLESKKSNYSILQACLQEITVRHFSEDSSDDVFDIIAPAKYTVGWLFLLETAKEFERIYREHDKDGDGNLTLNEIRDLLFQHGIRLQDSQLLKFKEQVDTDGDGNVSLEEFVQLAILLCSRSETKIKLPIPSTIANLDQNTTFITCKVQKSPSMNFTNAEVSVGRLQLQIASFPLRNAIDWMKLVTRADRKTENIKDLSESSDEVAAAIQQKQVAKPGLKVLRASFEGNSEDIFIPPKNSSELRFDMEEVDVVLHDMLMGEAALFFRAGPLSLSRSSMLPCEDGHPYLNKMQIALNRLRLLYARRKVDMDWDLDNILSETKCVFDCNQSMSHDFSGRTQDDALQIEGVSDDELRGVQDAAAPAHPPPKNPPPESIESADAALPLPPDNDIAGSPQGQISERVHDIHVTVHKIDEFSNTFGFFDRKDPYVLLQLGREKQNTSCKNDVRTCEKSRFYLMSCAVAGS
jgi:hypothetical protein